MPKGAKALMQISQPKISKILKNNQGFSLMEILVALLLAALVFLAVPSGDSAQKHRDLQTAVENIDRSIRFAANEAVLRNTVVRLRISMDEEPVEYTVEYGPAGNLPLPDLAEKEPGSLAEEKNRAEKLVALNRQFTKVGEFEDIRHEFEPTVSVNGIASSSSKKINSDKEASIYFYPTGEKDKAIIFFSTSEELAYLEIQPFLSETNATFEALRTSGVAKTEDVLQTRMEEVYKEWQIK